MIYSRIGKEHIKYIDKDDIMKYVDTIMEEYLPKKNNMMLNNTYINTTKQENYLLELSNVKINPINLDNKLLSKIML